MPSRNQYTYTPGYNGGGQSQQRRGAQPRQQAGTSRPAQPAAPRPARPAGQRPAPTPRRPVGDTVILTLLFIVAPLCGLVGIFVPVFLWIFIGVALLAVLSMWALGCFAARGRIFMSGVLLTLVVVSLIAVVDFSPDDGGDFPFYGDGTVSDFGSSTVADGDFSNSVLVAPTQTVNNVWAQPQDYSATPIPEPTAAPTMPSGPAFVGLGSVSPTATAPIALPQDAGVQAAVDPNAAVAQNVVDPGAAMAQGVTDPNAALMEQNPTGGTTSAPLNANYQAAQQVLDTYMQMWQSQNWEQMVEYTLPSWRSAIENPRNQLFWSYTSFKLDSWTISGDSATVADSASFTVVAKTTRTSGTRPQITQQYNALVFNVNGTWYVDPDSMRNGIEVVATEPPAEPGAAVAFTPEPTIDPNLELWYNSEGGSYYHASKDCSTINQERYGKSMQSFSYKSLSEEKYSKLMPCRTCHAPAKP